MYMTRQDCIVLAQLALDEMEKVSKIFGDAILKCLAQQEKAANEPS